MQRIRKKPEDRRESILGAALQAAAERGLTAFTRADVAERAKVTPGLVSHYFEDMTNLRRLVMEEAVLHRELRLVASGIALSDPIALAAPDDVKAAALASLAS